MKYFYSVLCTST